MKRGVKTERPIDNDKEREVKREEKEKNFRILSKMIQKEKRERKNHSFKRVDSSFKLF